MLLELAFLLSKTVHVVLNFFYHSLYSNPEHSSVSLTHLLKNRAHYTKDLHVFYKHLFDMRYRRIVLLYENFTCLHDTFQERGPTSQHPKYHEALSALLWFT